jgi:hypothetical protein
MQVAGRTAWDSHDFKVKTLDGSMSGAGGTRLGFTCRNCGRKFSQTPVNRRTWAVNDQGTALEDAVTDRWLAEDCLHRAGATDEDDRKRFAHKPLEPERSLKS